MLFVFKNIQILHGWEKCSKLLFHETLYVKCAVW